MHTYHALLLLLLLIALLLLLPRQHNKRMMPCHFRLPPQGCLICKRPPACAAVPGRWTGQHHLPHLSGRHQAHRSHLGMRQVLLCPLPHDLHTGRWLSGWPVGSKRLHYKALASFLCPHPMLMPPVVIPAPQLHTSRCCGVTGHTTKPCRPAALKPCQHAPRTLFKCVPHKNLPSCRSGPATSWTLRPTRPAGTHQQQRQHGSGAAPAAGVFCFLFCLFELFSVVRATHTHQQMVAC